MLDHPDAALVLQAIASFLQQDVRPALDDKALSFRVLIASHLAGSVAFEVQGGDVAIRSALERLGVAVPEDVHERRERLREAHADLCRRIRDGDVPEGALEHVLACLRDELQLTNPRFDLSPEIP